MLSSDLGLDQYGIHSDDIIYNPGYDELYHAEISADLSDKERGTITESGAVAIDTGRFTGRSPKDKYIVCDENTENTVWWKEAGSDNQKMKPEVFDELKKVVAKQLNHKKLYVIDGFCGASEASRLKVRLVTEIAWQAHFFKNMFIRPTNEQLEGFVPDWTIFNACKTTCENHEALGMRSEVFGAFNITEKMTLIGGTWYGGEIKKGIFSMMNYFLPLEGIGSYHCSANIAEDGQTALFFGLSGTGKTTLSTDPKRALIGDDEHGWDNEGVFNLEGGCYAKTIRLSKDAEPEIYDAIRRNALLENVVLRDDNTIDFDSDAKTENTRVSYPIEHIENIVKPVSKGGHPSHIIFLTCDAYGVLPPVSVLTEEQAMFQYLSGYTAKVAGTELGVTEPTATFSACFGQPFLTLHPKQYAEILGQKMREHGAKAYLVNTGWTGGAYGEGHRISIKDTRAIIDAILDGSIDHADTQIVDHFDLEVPTALHDVDSKILNPRDTWADQAAYDTKAKELAAKFAENYKKYDN